MVSEATIYGMSSILATTVLGLLVGLILMAKRFKEKGVVSSFFLGALGFFLAQYTLRIPILAIASNVISMESFQKHYYIIYCIFLAILTGACETIGRWVILRYCVRGTLTYNKAFSAGYGHGAIEAMIVLGYSLFNNIVAAVLINQDLIEEAMGSASKSEINDLVDTVVNTDISMYYCELGERVLCLAIQVLLMILLAYFMRKGRVLHGMVITASVQAVISFGSGIINGLVDGSLGSGITEMQGYIFSFLYYGICMILLLRFIEKIKSQLKPDEEKEIVKQKPFPKFNR